MVWREKIANLSVYPALALVLFLPFSAWIISLTGQPNYGLIRDLLTAIILLLSLPVIFQFKKAYFWLAVAFILWGAATYYWREASQMQWLRGFRFTFVPIALFLAIAAADFSFRRKKIITGLAVFLAIGLGVLGILQNFGLDIPLYGQYSTPGSLHEVSYVGYLNLTRLASVLSGPNAMALFLFSTIGLLVSNLRRPRWFFLPAAALLGAFLILTFSRSAVVGLIILLVGFSIIWLKGRMGVTRAGIIGLILFLIISAGGYYLYANQKYRDFITHAQSSDMRLTQYQRIWDQRVDIGFLGRGMGTAGPSSINRLDGGPNRWTENIYFDLFEETGLVGILLYIGFLLTVASRLYRRKNNYALLLLTSFSVAGLFINYYTGQVGIYLFWLAMALGLKDNLEDEKNTD